MAAVASTTDIALPENLYDTYRASKTGTTKFLTWLVDEAATAGHHLASKALFQQAKAPRLKGKERILQKKAALRKPFTCHIEQRTSRTIVGEVPNPGLHALPTFLFRFYRIAGGKGPIDPEITLGLSTAHKVIEDFIEEEAIRKKEQEAEKANEKSDAIDEERPESLPILKTAMAMGILDPGLHPRINGKCLHFGLCSRQMLQGFVNQKKPTS